MMKDDKQLAIGVIKDLLVVPLITTMIFTGIASKKCLESIISKPSVKQEIYMQDNYLPNIKTNYVPEIEVQEIKLNPETELFAQAIYGEARGQLNIPEYLRGVIGSIVTRAKRKGRSINEIILEKRVNEKKGETHQYTCFDPNDVNYKKIKNLQKNEIWNRCYSLAEKALNNKLDLPEVTNYFVGKNPQKYRTKKQAEKMKIPSWAFLMKDGIFVLGKDKKRIPVKPVYVVKINRNKHAYFYNFKYF